VTAVTNGSALLAISLAGLIAHAPFPASTGVLWALAAGASGGSALAIFYRALAAGKMGLTASVAAVLAAAIPAVFGILTEGLPSGLQIAGFALAGAGIWLVSRPDGEQRPTSLGWAALAGVGFAGFFLCIKQAGNGSALWIAACSRASALACTAAMVLIGRTFRPAPRNALLWAALAGCLDVSGSTLFVRAVQLGRLDAAVMLTSLYPVVTVLLARLVLHERFTRWRTVGIFAALAAVPLIAM
jgi:drug/metabolite transporter (DMT)-like permease